MNDIESDSAERGDLGISIYDLDDSFRRGPLSWSQQPFSRVHSQGGGRIGYGSKSTLELVGATVAIPGPANSQYEEDLIIERLLSPILCGTSTRAAWNQRRKQPGSLKE